LRLFQQARQRPFAYRLFAICYLVFAMRFAKQKLAKEAKAASSFWIQPLRDLSSVMRFAAERFSALPSSWKPIQR